MVDALGRDRHRAAAGALEEDAVTAGGEHDGPTDGGVGGVEVAVHRDPYLTVDVTTGYDQVRAGRDPDVAGDGRAGQRAGLTLRHVQVVGHRHRATRTDAVGDEIGARVGRCHQHRDDGDGGAHGG